MDLEMTKMMLMGASIPFEVKTWPSGEITLMVGDETTPVRFEFNSSGKLLKVSGGG